MTAIRTFFQEFWNRIPQIGVNDIIDILIVAFLFYTVMRLIRSTSAARIARSILLLLVVTGLTEIFKLYTLNWILSKILEIGVIALVIMFQPELRRMLERFGGRFFSNLISSSGSASPEQQAIEATVAACEVMSSAACRLTNISRPARSSTPRSRISCCGTCFSRTLRCTTAP